MLTKSELERIRGRIEVLTADITELKVDAVVNAANAELCGGGGVDGAIHRAAGPELLAECERLGGADTGQVKATAAYRLPSRYVFHAVGPVWRGGENDEDLLLRSCYVGALELAQEYRLESIAFPAISTGAYRFPLARANRIAVEAVTEFLARREYPGRVVFCCYSEAHRQEYRRCVAHALQARSNSLSERVILDPEELERCVRLAINPAFRRWVLFANGTYVIVEDPEEKLPDYANEQLKRFGPVHAGGPAGDFAVTTLHKAPGWVVSGHGYGMYTYVHPSEVMEGATDVEIGLYGRAKRGRDAEESRIVLVEERDRV